MKADVLERYGTSGNRDNLVDKYKMSAVIIISFLQKHKKMKAGKAY